MKAALATITLLAGCSAAATADKTPAPTRPEASKPEPAKPVAKPAAPQGEIVTALLEKMNGAAVGRPAQAFRKGAVAPIATPKPTATANGFVVQFASHATITTPTVYDKKVIVSGGFRAKELYAFEAGTGKPLWGIDLHDDGPSSPACESGVCVVNTESCTIFAIDAETGKQLWSYWLGDPLTSAPTIAGKRVFASYPQHASADPKKPAPAGANHALAAFDLKTGEVLWQVWLPADVMSAPVAIGEFVYVTTFDGIVIKLEQATGKIRYAMKANATSAPVVQIGKDGVEQMYYTRRASQAGNAAQNEMVIRADHNEPETKWNSESKQADYIDPKVQAKSTYNQSSTEQDAHNGFSGGAPAAATPDAAWSNVGVNSVASMQSFQGSRVVHLADRSINTMGDEVIATDNESGATLWKLKLSGDTRKQGGFLGTAPLAAGNHVLFGTLDGNVVSVDPKSGKSTATYAVGSAIRSQPVAVDGWIYVGTEDGKLVAINTKDATITGWSSWGGNAQRTGLAK
jgi:Ca-activated chloride channel homolog